MNDLRLSNSVGGPVISEWAVALRNESHRTPMPKRIKSVNDMGRIKKIWNFAGNCHVLTRRVMSATRRTGKRRSPNAPGPAFGYSLQVTRLTHLLIEAAEGSHGSLEVIDDVGVVDPDGNTTAVQTKSALTGNPLGDHSVALWKTLANWADAIATANLPADKLCLVLYVSKPASGPISQQLASATSDDEIQAAIAHVRTELLSNGPKADSEVKEHIDRFFAHGLSVLRTVIKAFRIDCGAGSPQADLQQALDNFCFREGRARQLADMACGWVKSRVDELHERGLPAILSRDEFHREYAGVLYEVCRTLDPHQLRKGPNPC